MAYTTTTTTSYGKRLGNSLGSILAGLLMFLIGTIILWWNEGNAVKNEKMLNEAQKVTIEMEKPDVFDPAMEGKMVHATALANSNDTLTDPEFGVTTQALVLSHEVEYYQWIELATQTRRDKMGGGEEVVTEYNYTKNWTYGPVESSRFEDPDYRNTNFVLRDVDDNNYFVQRAENVSFGAYKLNPQQVASILGNDPVELNISEDLLADWDAECQRVAKKYGSLKNLDLDTTVPAEEGTEPDILKEAEEKETSKTNKKDLKYVHVSGNTIYFGLNPHSPEIGDVRVSFYKVKPTEVSILAQVLGDSFTEFKAKNGRTFSSLVNGKKTMDEMYSSEHKTNNILLWLFRIIGTVLVISGLKGIFEILVTLFKVVPFLASVLNLGVDVICTVLGIAWALIVIALAWLFYRPWLCIVLLVLAGFLTFWLIRRGREKKAVKPVVADTQA